MKLFNYNSRHKFITALIVVGWAVYHFTGGRETINYHTNGNVSQTGDFKDGKNHGLWIWFYDNGKKQMQGAFQKGTRTGKWEFWDKEGNKIKESMYENDLLNGKSIFWDKEGNIIEVKHYIKDKEQRKEK